jgi:hypothetical protein
MRGEEEGQPASELVHIEPCVYGSLNIGNAVSQGERQFLRCGRSSLSDVIAANAYRVPARHILSTLFEDIGN